MAKAKGSNIISIVKGLRTLREAAARELDESLHSYLDGSISLAAWYPEEEFLTLVRALVKILPAGSVPDGKDPYVWIGEMGAGMHQDGVYSHLFVNFSMTSVSTRAHALWQSQHDTGHLKILIGEPGVADVELVEFGYPSREMCLMTQGYVQESFRLAGMAHIKMTETQCINLRGERCRWECTWDPKTTPKPDEIDA
jgi:hypothetical protein